VFPKEGITPAGGSFALVFNEECIKRPCYAENTESDLAM